MRLLPLFFFFLNLQLMAQELPFSTIPKPPQDYTAVNSINRVIQGLGFRFYWATEGLRKIDLSYRPSKDAKNTLETLQHIYNLSSTVLNAVNNKASLRPPPETLKNLKELRRATLNNLKQAADLFQKYSDPQLNNLNIIFEREGKQYKFPIWNLLNGPIADALYHTGQIVSFRRTSGNPIAKGVNVFLGIKN